MCGTAHAADPTCQVLLAGVVLRRPAACLRPSVPHPQDPKKYARAKELLIMDEEIKKARQVVEDVVAPP